MKQFYSFIYGLLTMFALISAAGFRFMEGEWITCAVMLFAFVWNVLIFTGKWEYPHWDKK